MRFPFTGLLPVHKPAGVSSRGVVDAVARALKMRAVGHAGTLDPIAAGVVVVCVGHATRLVDFLHDLPKRYEGRFLLGRSSASDDTEQPLELESNPLRPSREALIAALDTFRGPIMQRPCVFSAVHVDGKRAYALARKGRTVELEPKPVTIHHLELRAYAWPQLVLDVECSSGTYIRALGRDLADALGTKAVMEGLVRTGVGPFHLADAVSLDSLQQPSAAVAGQVAEAALRPAADAVTHLPTVVLSAELIEHIACGGLLSQSTVTGAALPASGCSEGEEASPSTTTAVAATDEAGTLVGILRPHPAGWRVRPNFVGRS